MSIFFFLSFSAHVEATWSDASPTWPESLPRDSLSHDDRVSLRGSSAQVLFEDLCFIPLTALFFTLLRLIGTTCLLTALMIGLHELFLYTLANAGRINEDVRVILRLGGHQRH